ncbi:MAG TPA: class I SAM-dependent methyltransferase [Acidimicrobiales bacterium]|nr:class I SAM-dependent methyltransferase [Acidimicrobiales bacterium]
MTERVFRYGLDAPGALIGIASVGIVLLVVGVVTLPAVAIVGIVLLAYAVLHVWGSAVAKVRRARRMLDRIPWRGDEEVLDVGCGHGLLLVESARHLTTGRAVGIDVWRQKDQWHNSREATIETARRAGVADRVDVRDGDATALVFEDASFDVVVSSLVLHNIRDRDERTRAIREIARVLKPGGHVAILDLAHTSDYAKTLLSEGLVAVQRSRTGVLFVPSARVLTARRPG